MTQPVDENAASDVRIATLKRWAEEYSKDDIVNELNIVCSHGESKNPVLKIIDKPTRLEFLTSIALTQHFPGLRVQPHYHVDDEGLPTFTASGGTADHRMLRRRLHFTGRSNADVCEESSDK